MYSLTCTLTFPDGATVDARIDVDTPVTWTKVKLSGSTERLVGVRLWETASGSFLPTAVRNWASALGATYSERSEGEYDAWPE